MRPLRRPPRAALLLLILLVLVGGLGFVPAALSAGTTTVRSVTVEPKKVPADGGHATIGVTVSLDDALAASDLRVTLTTTLGAFGSANGPNRISVALEPTTGDEATASATLVGDGRQGSAAVTARVGESARSATVTFVGAPARVTFEAPGDGAVLSAETPARLIVQVRDSEGVTIADESLTFSTDAGLLQATADPPPAAGRNVAGAEGSILVVRTDASGRASAFLHGEPGPVTVRASAGSGSAAATLDLILHGPPARLELTALREAIHLGDAPVPTPEGTLVAVLFDDGGRPVPRVSVSFRTDVDGVTVLHSGEGESDITDASGRAAVHLSAAGAAQPGPVTILAEAAGHEASVEIQIVGPAAAIELIVTAQAAGSFSLQATLTDEAGTVVPTGYRVRFTADDVQTGDDAAFDPATADAVDGIAQATFTLSGSPLGVSLRALVLDIAADVTADVPLPAAEAVAGILLIAGLNLVAWPGPSIAVSASLIPIAGSIAAVWRFDPLAGWQGYFPGPGFGFDFQLNDNDPLAVFARSAVVWPLP